jgi:hypothetical protein
MRMSISDADDDEDREIKTPARIGYCSPPVHSQFKPGQSGNPSGRSKGSQNLKTLFNKVLDEEISLREGADVRKITKAEAIVRGVVVGALKGDVRNTAILFRLVESKLGSSRTTTPAISPESSGHRKLETSWCGDRQRWLSLRPSIASL